MSFLPLTGERLLEAARRVLERVPAYATWPKRSEAGWFEQLPLLRREDLRATPAAHWVTPELELAAALAAGQVRPMTTSGSTDEPLRLYSDAQQPLPPGVWSLHGVRDDARLVNLTAPVCLGTSCPGDVAPYGEHALLLTFRHGLFAASDAQITRAVQAFNDFQPEIAFVNPVWLHWLHRRAQGLGLTLHQPELLCFTYQYPSRCQRRALQAAFRAPQVEFYGASEFGGTDLAIGCPEGHLHLVDFQAFAEVVPSEHPGHQELVFSTPLSRVMPLLRYAPGDLGALGSVEEGACSLWEVPTLELHGRVHDVLRAGDGVITTRAFDDAVGAIEGLEFYEARSRSGGLSMRCITAPGREAPVEAALRGAVSGLGFSRLDFVAVERLTLGESGKLRLTGEDERHPLEERRPR